MRCSRYCCSCVGEGRGQLGHRAAVLVPCLPLHVHLAYGALADDARGRRLWPLRILASNRAVYPVQPALTDVSILMTYIGFGAHLLWLSMPRIADAPEVVVAMRLTGFRPSSWLSSAFV